MAEPYKEVAQAAGKLSGEVRWKGETDKAKELRRELALAVARKNIAVAVDEVLPLTETERETLITTIRSRH